MLFSDNFTQALHDIMDVLKSKQNLNNEDLFRFAVEAWCEKLGWPEHAAHYGFDPGNVSQFVNLKDFHKHLSNAENQAGQPLGFSRILRKLFDLLDSSLQWLAEYCCEVHQRGKAMSTVDATIYLLIALAFAALGYAVYLQVSKNKLPNETRTRLNPATMQWVLVLVVNVGRDSVINAIRSGGIAALERDQLYNATQDLWVGTESDFKCSSLAQWFSEDRTVTEESEYDVHLIRIDIAGDDPGLHRGANQMDRLDAFRRFQKTGIKVMVSPRLPSKAYVTGDLYPR